MTAIGNVLGIDPGYKGGFAILTPDGIAQVFEMPKTERQIADLFETRIKPARIAYCMIEQIQHIPKTKKDGDKSGFYSNTKLNRNVGVLIGLLLAYRIDFEEILPQTWQSGLGIPRRMKIPKKQKEYLKAGLPLINYVDEETQASWKRRLMEIAQKLYPGTEINLLTADALLICEFARRLRYGFRGKPVA